MLIPRTLIFVRRGDEFLLIKASPDKPIWGGKFNGVGGHLERGEDVLNGARRELLEETGLRADLWLCGILIVDAGEIGISLYVLLGENPSGTLNPSREGMAEWKRVDQLARLEVVEDLPALLEKIRFMKPGDKPFLGRSFYDQQNKLQVLFE